MISKKLIGVSFILSAMLVGCTSSSSSNSSTSSKTPTDVTVERGPVLGATVTDSSGQTATQKNAENVYTFSDVPVYPIVVNGGWIDLDGNGIASSGDIKLQTTLKSYSTNVTPITTLVALSDSQQRQNVINSLTESLNIDEETLLSLPSSVNNKKVAALANAIYSEVIEDINSGTSTTISEKFSYEHINSESNSDYDEMLTLTESYFNHADNNNYSAADLEAYIVYSNDFYKTLSASDLVELNGLTVGDNTTNNTLPSNPFDSEETPTIQVTDYSFIAIYKNVSTSYGSGLGSSTGIDEYFQSVGSSTGCSSYGFTFLSGISSVSSITTTSYISSSGVCNEIDYSESNYSGSANFVYGNND